MNLVRSLYSRCEKQRFLWQAEQRTALFFSFCKAREGESFAREGHRLVVRGPKSGREPMYRLVVKTRKVGKALVKEEKTELQSTDEAVLRSASRYEVSTPGGRMHPSLSNVVCTGKDDLHGGFSPSSWKATLTKSARRDLISLQGRSFRCHFGATLMWPAKKHFGFPRTWRSQEGPL